VDVIYDVPAATSGKFLMRMPYPHGDHCM